MSVGDLRALVRRLRDVPVLGGVVKATDRVWWWRVIRGSGLVDTDFYAAQLGLRSVSSGLAIWHYVSIGFRRGMSLNPLFDEIHAGGGLPEVFRVPAMYAYLLSDRASVQVHPLWDAVSHYQQNPGAGPAALEDLWRARDSLLRLEAAPAQVEWTVEQMRSESVRAARTWRARRRSAGGGAPTAEAVRVVRVVQRHDRGFGSKLLQVAALVGEGRAGGSVALIDPDASQWVTASLLTAIEPAVRVRAYDHRAEWCRVVGDGAADGDGGRLVALDPRAGFTASELDGLLSPMPPDRCTLPVHREQDGTSCGIGIARIDAVGADCVVLAAHPHEDVERLGASVEVPAPRGRSFSMPRAAFQAAAAAAPHASDLGGMRFDPGLSIVVLPRLAPVLDEPELAFARPHPSRTDGGADRPDDGAHAERLLRLSGFEVIAWEATDGRAMPVLRRRSVDGGQRWAIKISSPAGRRGDVWGDTHFAQGLAAALRRQGQEVVIDAFGAARRPTAYLDDVNVVVRGPYRIDPPASGVNLEWIISHPDQITRSELERFDRVFAASEPWAHRASARWSVPVEPLLECTDVDKFHPRGLDRGTDIVFVGTARGIARPSVVAPVRAGIDVKVYGPDWRPFLPASAIAAESIANDELPARYETASVVLNDQWPAMRQEGFIAMRPFDVVAVGGRVISEQVHGIEDLFEGAVVTYRDAAHLVELLRQDPATIFPSEDRLAEIAEMIRKDHTFDARATVLRERAAAARQGSRQVAGR